MTIRAAGILIHTPNKSALYLKRGPGGDYPGYWCFPGGKIEEGETADQAADRETAEELGSMPEGHKFLWTRSHTTGQDAATPEPASEGEFPGQALPSELVDFTTYRQPTASEFMPALNGEHVGYAWAPIDQPPEPLHPGCRVALDKFGMTELGVADAIRDGRLTSPQQYENLWLFDIRITGTGLSFRSSIGEHVIRAPELYLNDEFLARCNGLPIIVEHPETYILNSEEFAERIIGTTFLPYIKGDEVWAIGKVFNDVAAKEMAKDQLSTSPAVLFRDSDVNTTMKLEDGSTLLIEGKPSLLDHIAVCIKGVWDKGGDPAGVVSVEIDDIRDDAEINEADHPRDEDGKFGSGGGSSKTPVRLKTTTLVQNKVSSELKKLGFGVDTKGSKPSRSDSELSRNPGSFFGSNAAMSKIDSALAMTRNLRISTETL